MSSEEICFLADENFPGPAVRLLREAGFDVEWIVEKTKSIKDHEVLELARAECRVILTFDKDFGELVFRQRSKSAAGVVLCRFSSPSPQDVGIRILNLFATHLDKIKGRFTVIGNKRVRFVLPPDAQF